MDRSVRHWCTITGECRERLMGHSGAVRSIVCSSDGCRALSASDDRTAKLWSVEEATCLLTIANGHNDLITSVDISDDGCTGITGSGDRTVRIWNLETGESKRELIGHWGV